MVFGMCITHLWTCFYMNICYSALAHVLLGQLKTAVIMIGAGIIFGSKYSKMQLVGAIGAVMAIIFYSKVTIEEKKIEKSRDEDTATLPLVQNKMQDTPN